jgi:hypothetical protein
LFELFKLDLDLFDGVADVFVELLGCKDLINNIKERAHLGDLCQDVLAVLLGDTSATCLSKLLVHVLSEILELLLINGEIVPEVESSFDWIGKFLELIESCFELSSWG